ncbi:hypothetical protein D3C76_475870 [compost metagenome]
MGMGCHSQRYRGVVNEIVELDEPQVHVGELLGQFAANALDGVPVFGAKHPIDIDLGHAQRILLVQQRNAAVQVGKLLDHGADHAVTRAAELGDEGDLAGKPHVAGQALEKILHLGSAAIGLHIGQQGGGDIAFTGLVLVDESIGGVVLARLWVLPGLEDESAHFDIQVFHETPADQPFLAHHACGHQGLAVQQLPGILDGTCGQNEISSHQALTIALIVRQNHRSQVAGSLVELQVNAITVDEHIQAWGLLQC